MRFTSKFEFCIRALASILNFRAHFFLGQRWPSFTVQNGGLAKMNSGFDYVANVSSFALGGTEGSLINAFTSRQRNAARFGRAYHRDALLTNLR
jgi:hypothetical protein